MPRPGGAVVTRRRGRQAKSAPPTTKPMEQMLWDAACSIRGEKDAPKFKDYLLPLLFLKRLSDVFDDEIARLAEEYGDRDVALEIAEADHALLRFYLPPEARWGVISGRDDLRLAARRAWPLDRAEGHRRAPDQGGARRRPAQPDAVRRHRRRRLRRRAQRRARHQPGQAARRRRDLLRPALPPRPGRRAAGLPRPRLRVPAPEVRRGLGPERRRVLHADRGRLPDGAHPAPEARRDLPRLRLRLRRAADQAPARRPRARPDEQGAAQDVRPGAPGRELRRRADEHDHPRHGRRPAARRHDDQPEVPRRRRARSTQFDIVVANPMWNQPFDPDIFDDDPFDRFTQGRRRHLRQGRLGVAAAHARRA